MGATYTRQSTFTDGDVIDSDLFNNEYDQLLAAFASSTGHTHDGTAGEGGAISILLSDSIVFGTNTGDITLTWNGGSNDGVLTWMEDEDYFQFSDDLLISTNEKIQFRDTAIYINSSADGQLDIVADTEIQIAATTIDINGAVALNGAITGATNITLSGELDAATLDISGNADIDGNLDVGGNLTVTGTTTFNGGTLTLGDSASDNVVFGADVDSNIIPDDDNTYDLGSASQEWRNLFIDGTANIDSLVADTADINGGTVDGAVIGGSSAAAITGTAITGTSFVIGSASINENDLESIDDITAGTVSASKAAVVDSNKDITGFRNITLTGELDAGSLDISGNADIDGTLEADAITVNGTALAEVISDTVGAMVSSNTESGITVAYQDADNTLDFTIGTLNQNTTGSAATLTTARTIGGVSFNGSANINLPGVNASGNQNTSGTAAIATTVTITDNENTNENNAIVFTAGGDLDGGNLGLESDGDLKYNPSTGTLSATNISVSGTLSTVDSVTMSANNAVVFEGATADAHETTLTVVDATADRTITLPNVSGTVPVLAAASNTQITSTPEELNALDGITAVVGELNALDIGSTAIGTAVASKAVILDSNKDYTGLRNLTITGELDAATLDISGAIDVAGTTNLDVVDIDGAVDMASTLTVAGVLTGASLDISGNIDVDGTTNLDVVDVDGAANFAADVTIATGADIITATAGTSNLRLGVNAGNSIQSGGNYNVTVGDEAGTAITTADNNTVVGYQASYSSTTGNDNVIVGMDAFYNGTTGSDNVLIGHRAGYNHSSGSSNVGIGYDALLQNTTASNNTAVGSLALKANTTGAGNVAFGAEALATNILGSNSTAIGREALRQQNFTSSTDAYNTAVGYRAGLLVTTGVQNTLIGGLAGDALTDADLNVAVGMQALTTDTLGSKSVAMGFFALGSQNFTSATDTFNVAVGHSAGSAVTTGTHNNFFGGLAGDALTDGAANVAIGFAALSSDTKGHSSVAIGHGALGAQNFTSTTDTFNTAVGKLAGTAVTTGIQNTLIGALAGDSLTTGGENTAVGYLSLSTEDGHGTNTAIGNRTLMTQNAGANAHNTAVGHYAGTAITTGINNTLIGGLTGDAITDGVQNVAVGKGALTTLTTGDQNVALGTSALEAATTGSTNVAVGPNAGVALTSGSNNLVLGNDAGRTGSPGGNFTTVSNVMCLGDENVSACNIQVDWTVASDARDKTDFTALDLGLDFVKALAPVTYKWDKRSKYGDKTADDYDLNAQSPDGTHKEDWLDIGFKAQEVEALEQAAGYNKSNKTNLVSSHTGDGKQMGLQYSKFVPILVKAIQEQNALIVALTARITTLEG